MSADNFVLSRDGTAEIRGPLTFDTVPELIGPARAWLEAANTRDLTVDLKRIDNADSAGLALLVEWLRLSRRVDRVLYFANIPEQLRRLIRVSGLTTLFSLRQ